MPVECATLRRSLTERRTSVGDGLGSLPAESIEGMRADRDGQVRSRRPVVQRERVLELLRVGVDVEGGGEPPALALAQEAVIAQVVVTVGHHR